MGDCRTSESDRVAQARRLLAAAAEGVKQLEDAAGDAFCRFFALTGLMARLEELAVSAEPDAAEAAALDADTVCRETKVLLRYIDAHGKPTAVFEIIPDWPSANRVAPSHSGGGGDRRASRPAARPPEPHVLAATPSMRPGDGTSG
jgi:hypothetical protein